MDHRLFLAARALGPRRPRGPPAGDAPTAVSALEDAVAARRWWAEQWPEGEMYVAGLVAQDVQDAAIDAGQPVAALPDLSRRAEHALHIQPDLGGPDPVWVCEESGTAVAELGRLSCSWPSWTHQVKRSAR